MAEEILAHVDSETGRKQLAKEHYRNVSHFAEENCTLPELKNIAYLIGLLHDAGKLCDEIQNDYCNILKNGDAAHQHGLDHSTAGGQIATRLLGRSELSDLISTVIYCHHGLVDCVDMQNGEGLQNRRIHKEIAYQQIQERFFRIIPEDKVRERCTQAATDYTYIRQTIKSFCAEYNTPNLLYGNPYFFVGMYWRLLLSLLIDGDWTDTSCFFQDVPIQERMTSTQTEKIWRECTQHFETYLEKIVRNNPGNGNALANVRQSISDLCKEAAETSDNLFRLTVPTGAGKTFSSFRFALHRARKENKQHIIYVSPYNSILEQNAIEIREAIGNPSYVLEHHCNVICDAEEESKYIYLTETWDAPIIATSAVQILNTLFSDQKSAIRRMHTLCNSIIIFDEIQAFPVRCTELFHLAVNFLTKFCNTTIVLCSATQTTLPVQGKDFYHVCPCIDMAGDMEQYLVPFKRTQIIDVAASGPKSMNIEDLKEFTLEKADEQGSVLVIVNTIKCALNLYQEIKSACREGDLLFHLSNNMCPQNKLDVLEDIKTALKRKREGYEGRIICVSTQVVEAGVNFSFGCVIRSKAGLDNVIQAAGRCNRHKEFANCCPVYIVNIPNDVEYLTKLKDIINAQKALQCILEKIKDKALEDEDIFEKQGTINAYYREYFEHLDAKETKFPVPAYRTTIVELLGQNERGRKQYMRKYGLLSKVGQAFATAGAQFKVISDNFKVNVVVPYDKQARKLLADLSGDFMNYGERGNILKQLQKYTVRISQSRRDELSNAVYELCDGTVLALSEGYYDAAVGVCDTPQRTTTMM